MLDVHHLKPEDLQGLDVETATKIAALLLDRVGTMRAQFDARDLQIKYKDAKQRIEVPGGVPEGLNGTLICEDYKGHEAVFKLGRRIEAGCAVHARREFDVC